MQTNSQQYRALYQKSMQYQEQMKKYLTQLSGGGKARPGTTSPGWMNGAIPNQGTSLPGGLNLQWGQSPNEQQVMDFIEKSGGNPYARQMRNMARGQGTSSLNGLPASISRGVKQEVEKNGSALIEELSKAYQDKVDEANAANEYRYQQGLGELGTLRDRGLNDVANWGQYEGEVTKEQYDSALQDQLQMLTDRGLGNDTISAAFKGKNARDKRLALQNLSERVSDRTAQYDKGYTNDMVGFIERRNDVAPDMRELYALAEKYGQSGNGEGFQQPQEVVQQQPQLPQGYEPTPVMQGMSPWAAQSLQSAYGAQMPNYQLQFGIQNQLGSNAYPTRREPREQQSVSNTFHLAARQAVPELNKWLGTPNESFRMQGVPFRMPGTNNPKLDLFAQAANAYR